jgi:F-type H+-transporting ATPase subunit b
MEKEVSRTKVLAVKAFKAVVPGLLIVALLATCALAAEGGEEPATTGMDWVWRVVNFGIIVGALIYFLAKPLKSFLKKRIEDIETSLAEAKASREEALKRLADVQARLKDKDAEIQSLIKVAEQNGGKEKEEIIKEAERVSQEILASAKENIDSELIKAKDALRREAALMAVELAEKMVKENISKEDQARILEEYIAKVGGR